MEHTAHEKQKTSAKDFFLHLLSIVTLYVSAISLGTVLFQVINLYIPDTIGNGYGYYPSVTTIKDTLRNALSLVIVFFPVYAGTIVYLAKMYSHDPHKRDLRVRKWLIYFTLFAAIIIILSSLASLVHTLLGGELTSRFVLKVLTIMGISAGVLGYYGIDIKKHGTE